MSPESPYKTPSSNLIESRQPKEHDRFWLYLSTSISFISVALLPWLWIYNWAEELNISYIKAISLFYTDIAAAIICPAVLIAALRKLRWAPTALLVTAVLGPIFKIAYQDTVGAWPFSSVLLAITAILFIRAQKT